MSDAALMMLLTMIHNKLSKGIDILEKELPEEFRVVTGGSHVFLDPKVIDYPILQEFYELRYDLYEGIESLKKQDSQK